MFLIQIKPVVTFKNINPGPYLLDIEDPALLEQTVEKALDHPPALMQQITAFTKQTHPYVDGKSSRRVISAISDVLVGKYPLHKHKPLNIIRNLKYRKRLKYWKP
jgi:hypothetical protein